jgi:hypothetical protein
MICLQKILTSALLGLFIGVNLFAQDSTNVFLSFEEFANNEASELMEFELNQRSDLSMFRWGGFLNYRIKKARPSSNYYFLNVNAWGVIVKGKPYINSYPYSGLPGYNEILGTGLYRYFLGEPARSATFQLALGFIQEGETKVEVCCKTTFVILPNGVVQWLNPALLKELIKDNETLVEELDSMHLTLDKVPEMLDVLERYNGARK